MPICANNSVIKRLYIFLESANFSRLGWESRSELWELLNQTAVSVAEPLALKYQRAIAATGQ